MDVIESRCLALPVSAVDDHRLYIRSVAAISLRFMVTSKTGLSCYRFQDSRIMPRDSALVTQFRLIRGLRTVRQDVFRAQIPT